MRGTSNRASKLKKSEKRTADEAVVQSWESESEDVERLKRDLGFARGQIWQDLKKQGAAKRAIEAMKEIAEERAQQQRRIPEVLEGEVVSEMSVENMDDDLPPRPLPNLIRVAVLVGPKNAPPAPITQIDPVNPNAIYDVEKILDCQYIRNKVMYLIKWEENPQSDNSWQPLANLNGCPALRQAFHRQNPGLPKSDPKDRSRKEQRPARGRAQGRTGRKA